MTREAKGLPFAATVPIEMIVQREDNILPYAAASKLYFSVINGTGNPSPTPQPHHISHPKAKLPAGVCREFSFTNILIKL